ncbi:MAG: hypothetical protein RID09_13185 [Coleofasciculus sp. G1-WW12-02]|uniref:hypothetical protein n=1 Tax=Coleofasciculus sp. G1-WW12-02 TaxID=3068483 RepID=UPI0032F101D3
MPPRWTADWLKLGWKIGLLLPFVGTAFWVMTGWIDQRVLSQTHSTTAQLQAQGQYQVQLSFNLTIVSIDAEINRQTQLTEVSIRTVGSSLEEMEFKFPVTEFVAVERAIAQELGLLPNDITKLIRYRIDE